jgi:hypothetical protein
MNSYEIKQQERKERFEERAKRARERAEQSYQRSSSMFGVIPFGQPILVGHYSEKGDRAYRNRAGNLMRKSIEEDKKADYYERRAEAIDKNTSISSDDPEAVEKLKVKLAKLEDYQRDMKERNAEARAHKTEQPFARFQLTNNGAVIRGMKQRIELLEKKQQMVVREDVLGDGWRLTEDLEENRIMFFFDGKPEENIRIILKSHGFKWSYTRSAWVRMLNGNGRFATDIVIKKLTN